MLASGIGSIPTKGVDNLTQGKCGKFRKIGK